MLEFDAVLLAYSFAVVKVAFHNDSRLVVLERELMSLHADMDDLPMHLHVLGDFGTMVGLDIEAAHDFDLDIEAMLAEHGFDEDLEEERRKVGSAKTAVTSPGSIYFDWIRNQLKNDERSANKNPVDSENRARDVVDCLLSAGTWAYDPYLDDHDDDPNHDAVGTQLETTVEAFSNALSKLESSLRRHQNPER